MSTAYMTATKLGAFTISREREGWFIWHNSDKLDGPFRTAHQAAYDLANGHCCWPSAEDPSTLSIPEELSDWTAL